MAWLRLLRVALAPTIAWDVAAGLWLAGLAFDASAAIALGCGLLIYHGGMVLNDWADRTIDREHRPGRPIPSGQVAAPVALGVALAMFLAANGAAFLWLPSDAWQLTLFLTAVVLAYDLGGSALRKSFGPPLLALARMGSLHLGVAAHGGLFDPMAASTVKPMFAYGMWILFTSRLAAGEEDGSRGMRSLQFVIGCAVAPILLTVPEPPAWPFFPGWILLAAFVLWPAWRDHNNYWVPERVQAAVRLHLQAAPCVLGLALLAAGYTWQVALAPMVTLAVGFLARRFPPE